MVHDVIELCKTRRNAVKTSKNIDPYGPNRRPRRRVGAVPITLPEPQPLDEVRREIERLARMALRPANGDETPLMIVAAPGGTGKSSIVTEVVNDAAKRGMRILYFCPRHDQFEDVADQRQEWLHVYGRSDRNCVRMPAIRSLQDNHHATDAYCGTCPQRVLCPYQMQFRSFGSVVFLPHQYLLSLDPQVHGFDAVIIDEFDVSIFVERKQYSRLALRDAADNLTLSTAVRRLCAALAMTCVSPQGMEARSGQPLVAALASVLSKMTVSLSESVSNLVATLTKELAELQSTYTAPICSRETRLALEVRPNLIPLIDVVIHELGEMLAGRDFNGRMSAMQNGIEIALRRELGEWSQRLPVLVLDASVDVGLVAQVFAREPTHVYAPQMTLPPDVAIVQVAGRFYSKRSVTDPSSGSTRIANVGNDARTRLGAGAALVTFKDVETRLRAVLETPPEMMGHFGALRGSNAWTSAERLAVIGTPEPNPEGLLTDARALWWDQVPLDERVTTVPRLYGGDGYAWEIDNREYVDERLNRLLRSKREQEVMQAVLRIRPFTQGERGPLTVILYTSLPLSDLPITKFEVTESHQAIARTMSHERIATAFASVLERQPSCSVDDLIQVLGAEPSHSTIKRYAVEVAESLGLVPFKEVRRREDAQRARMTTVYCATREVQAA